VDRHRGLIPGEDSTTLVVNLRDCILVLCQ
jgi:hypothetical protein